MVSTSNATEPAVVNHSRSMEGGYWLKVICYLYPVCEFSVEIACSILPIVSGGLSCGRLNLVSLIAENSLLETAKSSEKGAIGAIRIGFPLLKKMI